ncbi:hypothetical protein BKN14_02220 [Candidatus Gracilibacteria bacterium HOT-871]|nr:hypothetical protein BKN14_02220 [Candidatus Gracilibacteria bacterium HOT-871]
MQEASFLSQTLSVLSLLVFSGFSYILSKKINFPYTVLLVIVGILLIPVSNLPFFAFLDDFVLTPDVLFYIFLPILLFESAYNIKYKQLISNWKSISILSVVGLLISSFVIAFLLFWIFPILGLEIPFLACLLFGSLISATDPVAVLSIFKKLGAPRRLTIIFEGESLFNDGTAVALFTVILGIIISGGSFDSTTFASGVWKFASMVFGGMIFGFLTGFIFSQVIGKVTNNEEVEIVLTMLLAHFTFILSELITHFFHFLPISGVISTVVASLVIGNYGRYKITPKVEAHMQKFWEFFAFISNSLIFILLGLWMSKINLNFSDFVLPITVVIIVVMIARAISVYLPIFSLNKSGLEERIPASWMHLLSWGSLRGALALIMVLLIPDDLSIVGWSLPYSIKDFLLLITISCICFTLFVKAVTTPFVMKFFGVDKLNKLEKFEYEEGKILASLKILQKLNSSYDKGYLTFVEYDELKDRYSARLHESTKEMKSLLKEDSTHEDLVKKVISLHSLGIEKQYLKELFYYNEIDERSFKYILRRIEKQIERLEQGKEQLRKISGAKLDYDIFTRFLVKSYLKKSNYVDCYIRNRSRVIITRKVIKELKNLKEIDFGFNNKYFDEIIELYTTFNKNAENKKTEIFKTHRATINALESRLVNKSLLKLEEKIVDDLYSKEMITPKLYLKFIEEIENEMYADVKTII